MGESIIQRTFAGGELAPIHHSRADTAKYLQGARTLHNFMVRREGGISNRSGLRFIQAAKTNTAGTRFMRYVSATGSDFLIEMGSGYFRFFRDGARVTVAGVPAWNNATNYVPGDLVADGGINYYCITANINDQPPSANWHPLTGNIYEIPTPYSLATLPDWDQSANVITLTHVDVGSRELIFESATRWILRIISTVPATPAPTGVAATAGAPGALTYAYLVTAAGAGTFEESGPSASSAVACAEPTAAAPNTVGWNVVAGAEEYYVYLDQAGNGIFGYIGTAKTNSFNDTGFLPDYNVTPPILRALFSATNERPRCSSRFQQRRFFASTNTEPDAILGSRTGFPSNFSVTSPIQDDDAVTFRIASSGNQGTIRHMRTLKVGLVLLTDGGAWPLTGGGGPKTPITPSSIDAEQETYAGAAPVRPVVLGNTIVYVEARQSIVRALNFDQQVDGLAGKDLTIWATHLFERKQILAIDIQRIPHSITWTVLSDGTLAGLTYIPDQEVWGWHRHSTINGSIEDVCVIGEGEEDAVYVLVSRTISGATVRYIERLARREIREGFFNADSFFVDSGLSYSGAAATVFSGLGHLEGQRVAVLADGVVVSNGADTTVLTVTAGAITIPTAASNVHIGLPIQYPDLETLDLDVSGSSVRDKKKRIPSVSILIERSSRSLWAGPDVNNLRQYQRDEWENTASEATAKLEVPMPTDYNDTGRVLVRQKDPLPLTILGIIPNVELGG